MEAEQVARDQLGYQCSLWLRLRLRGKKAILETGIWVENTATHHHYDELLRTIDWDEDTRRMIEKNRADEDE